MTDAERFWRRVTKTSTCWLFGYDGKPDAYIYWHFKVGNRLESVHRYSAKLAGLVIPPGMDVCHSCEAKNCVRPAHLYIATHRQNIRDMAASRFARGLCDTTVHYPTTAMLRWCAGFVASEAA